MKLLKKLEKFPLAVWGCEKNGAFRTKIESPSLCNINAFEWKCIYMMNSNEFRDFIDYLCIQRDLFRMILLFNHFLWNHKARSCDFKSCKFLLIRHLQKMSAEETVRVHLPLNLRQTSGHIINYADLRSKTSNSAAQESTGEMSEADTSEVPDDPENIPVYCFFLLNYPWIHGTNTSFIFYWISC